MSLLPFLARHARWMMLAGLAFGIAVPQVTQFVRPWLSELVALMLFTAALRIGPRAALGAVHQLRGTLGALLVFQLLCPLALVALAAAFGLLESPAALALILLMAAAPLASSPNLTLMVGGDPGPALRMLILGMLILPATTLPVFALLPTLGGAAGILGAALKLLLVIVAATGLAFALRPALLPRPASGAIAQLDGASALLMTTIVLALTSEIRPALLERPAELLGWMVLAFAANLGPQVLTLWLRARGGRSDALEALAMIAGNRNIGLFLVALPTPVTDPLLLFIGCYQVPMFLTPLLMTPLYRRARSRAAGVGFADQQGITGAENGDRNAPQSRR
ncbi:hypothetical protein [Alloyangia pacifica]|uniref:Predicted Na+-dependent transporter n=1 Tax=Alloyangia pacifica TaxID=311180 RepID=A0A1I6W3D1_9RHOB|nr:hypothetical protein [Alloyangia pacifica]SDI39565.1 Predicted Na+-dependent transporter [Alloyangia pacifica]SFT20221.1 Predicted Na+-dependent transporter [Alloyangia pacifica]